MLSQVLKPDISIEVPVARMLRKERTGTFEGIERRSIGTLCNRVHAIHRFKLVHAMCALIKFKLLNVIILPLLSSCGQICGAALCFVWNGWGGFVARGRDARTTGKRIRGLCQMLDAKRDVGFVNEQINNLEAPVLFRLQVQTRNW